MSTKRSKIGSALRWLANHIDPHGEPAPHPHTLPSLHLSGRDAMIKTSQGWINVKVGDPT